MNQESQLESLDVSIDQAKAAIELRQSFLELQKDKRFKALITEGYFKDEAIRLVMLKSDSNMQSPDNQRMIENAIIGVGNLRSYFQAVVYLGDQMEASLADFHEAKESILSEGM
jgi:hypothetical protein